MADNRQKIISFFSTLLESHSRIHVAGIDAKGTVKGRVFSGAAAAASYALLCNTQTRNVYFTLNGVDLPEGPKAKISKDQISHIRGAHIDIDPPDNFDFSQRDEWVAQQVDRLKALNVSLIVDSGNGVQGIFLFPPETKPAVTVPAVEDFNRALINQLQGDPGTWNADRLLRVPWTTNYTSKKKLADGYPSRHTTSRLIYDDAWYISPDELSPLLTASREAPPLVVEAIPDETQAIGPCSDAVKDMLKGMLTAAMRSNALLRRRMSGDSTGLTDASRSAIDKSIAVLLKNEGFSVEEFYHLVTTYPPTKSAFVERADNQDYRYFRRCYGLDDAGDVVSDVDAPDPHAKNRGFHLIKASSADIPPLAWLIDGVLEEGALSLVLGKPKLGKTFCVLDMGLSIAAGISWADRNTQQGSVVYVAGEGHRSLARRVSAWCARHKLSPDDLPFYYSSRATSLTDPQAVAELVAVIQQDVPDISLIVFDTLARNLGGNENDSEVINKLFNVVDNVLKGAFPTLTTLVVAHPGKSDPTTPRGSSALSGNADALLQLYTPDDCPADRQIVQLNSVFHKESAGFDPFLKELVRSDEYDTLVATCVTKESLSADREVLETIPETDEVTLQTMKMLQENPAISIRKLADALDRSKAVAAKYKQRAEALLNMSTNTQNIDT